MHIKNFRHKELFIDELSTEYGQIWCFFGENNSGIDRMLELLSKTLTDWSAETLELPEHPEILSFQAQQKLYEDELRNDDSDFMDRMDPGTLVCEFLPDYQQYLPLLQTFALEHCLQLGYRQLSSGQARKLLFVQKIIAGGKTLIIQNPYDGLDEQSCHELDLALQHLPDQGFEIILLVNRTSDIPQWCTHIALINAGQLEKSGDRALVEPILQELETAKRTSPVPAVLKNGCTATNATPDEELIFLQDGFAGYNGETLFKGLDLVVRTGDHTLITGTNGCGKSTLLDIITGDNPKCYANNLRIFGRARGSGESIWEIKKQMGIVSPGLHREHRVPGSALQVILSGLYDSIGLYVKVSTAEVRIAERWLAWLSLSTKSSVPFRRLTFAEQRLVLIARALIKQPKLLILDEPSQGLDDGNRGRLLDLMDEIATKRLSTILFVSHRRDEHRPFFRRQIHLDDYAA